MRTYRLALACTSSYASSNGGTKASVLSAMNSIINMLNAITERELAIHFQIIENNDTLIFLDPATEPYVNTTDVSSLINQNTNVITQTAKVPGTSFDVGHVFTGSCTGSVVGLAVASSACTSAKAAGVTCFRGSLSYVLQNVLAHELGHQFGARHSWNNCPAALDQRASNSAFEPGSGSTIMSYGGACGAQNVQFAADPYYHAVSLEEIFQFSRQGPGNNCPEITNTDNLAPSLSLEYTDNFFIPINTPFSLSAQATDANGDQLTYCWEQFDLGPVSDLDNPSGNTPIFRSFPPNTSPTRVFPRLETILNNATDNTELLPSYSRNLTFRCTVRDNNPQAGGTTWDQLSFKATATAGPFLLTHPNASTVEWKAGEYTEVTWDVANTDNELVNCKKVNILLSTDGGFTYPIMLAKDALNDGSEFISVPDLNTKNARIRIEAADNIFFDVSNANFEIWPATQEGFAIATSPYSLDVCLPDQVAVNFNTNSLVGFSDLLQLEVMDGLPEGALASFSANPIRPNDSASLYIDLRQVNAGGRFDLNIRAIAEGVDTAYRTVTLNLFSTDFSDQTLDLPAEGTNGIGLTADFGWTPSVNALSYDFELSNTPTFDSLITSADQLNSNSFSPPDLRLEENTIHYWRIRPHNECGEAGYSKVATFRTETVSCQEASPTSVPVLISGTGKPTVESTIEIATDGVISDVNIPLIKGSYQPVNSLKISLISPAGTEVVLFNKNCGTTLNILMGFDDEAPESLACPPDDGIVFKPTNELSAFNGENAKGTWTLRFQVVEAGFGGGGAIDDWKLEFCGMLTPQNPVLVTNDTLALPPGNTDIVTIEELEVQDDDNSPEELHFILLSVPAKGSLQLDGETLHIGDQFTQADINAGLLKYTHSGTEAEFDSFTFIVDDGTGGWLSSQQFILEMDPDATTGTRDLPVVQNLRFFPNPAQSELFVELPDAPKGEATLQLFNIQGQLLLQQRLEYAQVRNRIDISTLIDGVYIVTIQTVESLQTGKVVVQR